MKIRDAAAHTSQKPATRSPAKSALPTAATPQSGGLESKTVKAQRTQLAGLATQAAAQAIAANPGKSALPAEHHRSLLEHFGEALGTGLGVVVTEALSLVPSWNTRVLDANGKPAQHIPGADRIGEHDLLKRHQEVVGPQINALVAKLQPGMVHDLLQGLGDGASAAPGVSYRLEARIADMFK